MSKKLLDKNDIERALLRISHEIIERNKGVEALCIVGIQKGGVHLAERIAERISKIERQGIPTGSLDITFYRDDLGIRRQPTASTTDIPCNIDGRTVVLVDDVLFTGRSIRAAMDALLDIGRPSRIQLAVLIDRGHRELPIRADYVGKNIPTSQDEVVLVMLTEEGEAEDVVKLEKGGPDA